VDFHLRDRRLSLSKSFSEKIFEWKGNSAQDVMIAMPSVLVYLATGHRRPLRPKEEFVVSMRL